ncbi:MAG: PD-(D/E)XK nuclease family protein [Corynebacteriales bacterium]|nr:PD-(D/E)XK nuclease family protein [Mycobacteriales bacterium]
MPRPPSGQLGFPGMPEQLFVCTPAKLNTYEECPRKYRYTYLDRPAPRKGPPWAHMSVGAALHLALRAYWDLPLAARVPEAAERLLANAWINQGFRDQDQERGARARAKMWLTMYLATLDPREEPLGAERTVAMKTSAIAFSGRVDRVDGHHTRRNEAIVIDYKTGRTPPTDHDAASSRQLALYALATSRTLRRACQRVELHHLPSGTVASHTHTEASLARHLRRAEATAQDVQDGQKELKAGKDPDRVFPANPGSRCGWCDFNRVCAEGQRAADPQEPWAALSPKAVNEQRLAA